MKPHEYEQIAEELLDSARQMLGPVVTFQPVVMPEEVLRTCEVIIALANAYLRAASVRFASQT